MSLQKSFFGSIHSRLFWVLCATAIPIFAGLFFFVYQQRNAIIATNRQNAQDVADLAALYEQRQFNSAVETLQTIAVTPFVSDGDWTHCDRYFARLLQSQPRYSNLGVIGTDGRVRCSGLPVASPGQTYLGDRSYFRRAMASDSAVVGDYQLGRITGAPTIVVALKIRDGEGVARGVVYASLSLAALEGPDMGSGLSRQARFVVLDRGGAVLHASPAGSFAPGSRLDSEALWRTVQAQLRGATEIRGKDGSDWYASHAAAGTPDDPHAISVVYEIPSAELLARANYEFAIGLAIILLLVGIALAAGWAVTQVAVGRNIRYLTDAAGRLARRDFSVRVADRISGREFLDIGRQLDRMAQDLAAHERQLRATAERYAGQNHILQLIAQSHPLDRTLDELARFIEGQIDEAIGSIVIPDPAGARIAQCIGPHLPDAYKTALLGLEIGPDTGSCGTAMHEEKPVITEDIDYDPRWDSYRHLAQAHGLAACWSWPIMAESGGVLGSFAIYSRRPRAPGAEELMLIQMAAELAAVAIERERIKQTLRQSEIEYRHLFERNPNPMLVYSDATLRILAANDSAIAHYGYERGELLGMDMRSLQSREYPAPHDQPDDGQHPARMHHRRKDGSILTVEVSLFPLHFAAQPAHLALINDLTDRETMARNIVERDQMLSLLMDSTSEAIYGLDMEGRCTFANNACVEQLGYDGPEELVGKPFHNMVHHTREDGRPYPLEECPLYRALKTNQSVHIEGDVLWRKDGSFFPVEYWSYPTTRDGAVVGCVVTFLDISERRRQREVLEYQATHDSLTGLLSRNVLLPRIDAAIAEAMQNGGHFSVMVIDLDGFKEVNDALGHQSGDVLLREVGKRFLDLLGTDDPLIRLGGDEFAVVFRSDPAPDAAVRAAQRLLQAVGQPFKLNQLQVQISASLGIARYPQDGTDSGTLMRHADIAMYRSKRERAGYALYDHVEGARAAHRIVLMADLRNALDKGEFLLYFQPKISLSDGRTVGFEALARWQHHERGLIQPVEFIPLIEVTDLIHPFSSWVIESAVAECARWHADGIESAVAINISTRNLLDVGLPARLEDCLRRNGLPPRLLELEITESSVMADPARSLEVLTNLHRIGVSISIDDFGTGYSSLAYLQKLPVDSLKIDRSFVGQMNQHRDAMAIVSSIIGLAHMIDVSVVAEGIENDAAMTTLRGLGCDYAQGFYVAHPMPAHRARTWLKDRIAA